jgi:hypothetical protein
MKMKDTFEVGKPIEREPFIKIKITFMLMDCDNYQSKSVKIDKSQFHSDDFRKFMMYSELCMKCGPKTKGAVEGFEHIKNIDLYFENIIDDQYDSDDNLIENSLENNNIRMRYPSVPEYYRNGNNHYHFNNISVYYYDEYGNKSYIYPDFGDAYKIEFDILRREIIDEYNNIHKGEYGYM